MRKTLNFAPIANNQIKLSREVYRIEFRNSQIYQPTTAKAVRQSSMEMPKIRRFDNGSFFGFELNSGEHVKPIWAQEHGTAIGLKNKFDFAGKIIILDEETGERTPLTTKTEKSVMEPIAVKKIESLQDSNISN